MVAFASSYLCMHFDAREKHQELQCGWYSIFITLYIKITFLANANNFINHQWLCLHLVTLMCTWCKKNSKNCNVVVLLFLAPGIRITFWPTMTIQLGVNGCFYLSLPILTCILMQASHGWWHPSCKLIMAGSAHLHELLIAGSTHLHLSWSWLVAPACMSCV